MKDYSNDLTDAEMATLERRIKEVYREVWNDLEKTVCDYFAKFEKRDKEMHQLVEAGELSLEEYKQWRLTQMGRGERFDALAVKMAERCTQANEVANRYVNDITPGIYALNRNYEAYQIEKTVGNCDFTLFDEATVRRLIVEQPDLMPYYPPKRALRRGIDLAYGKDQITKRVASGILRGLSPGKIAAELTQGITGMSRESAVRAARTGVTAAQSAGRMDSYAACEKMGIAIRRQWVAAKDVRTRDAHGMADGQIVDSTDTPFIVGGERLMYPGDTSLGASGHNIYNCRCRMRIVEKDGIEAEPRQMRVRNPVTGKNELVNEMTYSEWVEWKQSIAQAGWDSQDADALKFFAVNEKDSLNSIVKRATMKMRNGFSCFPDGDVLTEYVQKVKPLKTYFDVAMHGTPTMVGFGSDTGNMSAHTLASIIRHSEGYNGQKIRLLSCSTGRIVDGEYCFAEELANALGVEVKAPNDLLYITKGGKLYVGDEGEGRFVTYKPNERGRVK